MSASKDALRERFFEAFGIFLDGAVNSLTQPVFSYMELRRKESASEAQVETELYELVDLVSSPRGPVGREGLALDIYNTLRFYSELACLAGNSSEMAERGTLPEVYSFPLAKGLARIATKSKREDIKAFGEKSRKFSEGRVLSYLITIANAETYGDFLDAVSEGAGEKEREAIEKYRQLPEILNKARNGEGTPSETALFIMDSVYQIILSMTEGAKSKSDYQQ